MFVDKEAEVLKVDTEAIKIRLLGEPYVVYNSFGYQAAVDIWHIKKRRQFRLYLSAKSLSSQLEKIRNVNALDYFTGIEFWISKASNERSSAYALSE